MHKKMIKLERLSYIRKKNLYWQILWKLIFINNLEKETGYIFWLNQLKSHSNSVFCAKTKNKGKNCEQKKSSNQLAYCRILWIYKRKACGRNGAQLPLI